MYVLSTRLPNCFAWAHDEFNPICGDLRAALARLGTEKHNVDHNDHAGEGLPALVLGIRSRPSSTTKGYCQVLDNDLHWLQNEECIDARNQQQPG